MATAFPSAPTPYTLTPQQWVALSNLNLNPGGNPSTAGTAPVASYGLTQGTPAVQSTPQGSTQAALQTALSNALTPSGGLSSFIQSLLSSSNPTAAAQAAAGSASTPYTPTQPSNAFRLNFGGGSSFNGQSPLFG